MRVFHRQTSLKNHIENIVTAAHLYRWLSLVYSNVTIMAPDISYG